MKTGTHSYRWRRFACTVAAGATLSIFAIGTVSRGAPTPALDAFAGVWTRSAHDQDDAARVASVERATSGMPFWMRGIARSVMGSRMAPVERFTIRVTELGLMITNDDDDGRAFRVDDRELSSDYDRFHMRFADGALEEAWRHGDDSYGNTIWALSASGELIVTVTAYDGRLLRDDGTPIPIRYATRYSRSANASSSELPE